MQYHLRHHLHPQSLLAKDQNFPCEIIMKFENLDTELLKYGINLKSQKDNSTSKYKLGVELLSRKSLNLINEIYNDDFVNFEYTKL